MPNLVTKETGGMALLMTEATVTPPEQAVSPDTLAAFMPGTGLNGTFLADLMSSFCAHERMGYHLYRTVAGLTSNPLLKRKYEEFGEETRNHIRIFEDLVVAAGGVPGYVSCSARLVEAMNMKMLEAVTMLPDGASPNEREMAMLEAVILAEQKCHADWQIIMLLTERLPEGELRNAFAAAVAEVEAQEDHHVSWGQETWMRMILSQADASLVTS